MSKKIIRLIILFILFIGCNKKQSSLGDVNTLTVLSSCKDKFEAQHIIEHFISQHSIATPQNEMIYSIYWPELSKINESKLGKNLLLLSLSHPKDSTADILIDKIMDKNDISDNVSSLENLFAKNQKAIILKSTDTIELEQDLSNHFAWILSEYN